MKNNEKKCNCNKHNMPVNGNFVPLIKKKIDLASSTHVNNPIIPIIKPPDALLKNKKYQAIIGFENDSKGEIWPEWMKAPLFHALGIDNISAYTSAIVSATIDDAINSALSNNLGGLSARIEEVNDNLNILCNNYEIFINTPASDLSLGLVKSSDKINQISVLNDGTMELNDVALSKISQDVDLIIYNPSIAENPNGENYFNLNS